MTNSTIQSLGGNKYSVEIEGVAVEFDMDGIYFGEGEEEFSRAEFLENEENPLHAEALMDYLHI